MQDLNSKLRAIPNVHECLRRLNQQTGLGYIPAMQKKAAVRLYLGQIRKRVISGRSSPELDMDEATFFAELSKFVQRSNAFRFQRVINGSGVIIHTNMGRSLLPQVTTQTLAAAAQWYSNLELDLQSGKRGSRYSHIEDQLCLITGAEAALVVNNNAAAVLIVLETLAKNRQVIVSRGQLVEIGGSFRIPEVMERSGAVLVEVGATNRTHLRDYEAAITDTTGALLKVHCSNYRIIGFTSAVSNQDLVALGRRYSLPVIEDLGSGSFVDLARFGLEHEPTVQEVVRSGVDVVTFSGDKLLGGPQAGIIVGRKKYIEQIKRNPLNRALRIDKFTLAGLESILRLYRDEETACSMIPTLAMMAATIPTLEAKAYRCVQALQDAGLVSCDVKVIDVHSRVGGGAMPEQNLPSKAIALVPEHIPLSTFEKRLRALPVPLIGRIEKKQLIVDMRTIQEEDIPLLVKGVVDVCSGDTCKGEPM
ncbi:MAG: L-seryl-tRNA(Sec) selenium transferase [Desulfobulbus propionicus]|nr:MAG: L-seryl-tRNA(Sec) selenium transferase [Desulfobulbus propionicus]